MFSSLATITFTLSHLQNEFTTNTPSLKSKEREGDRAIKCLASTPPGPEATVGVQESVLISSFVLLGNYLEPKTHLILGKGNSA